MQNVVRILHVPVPSETLVLSALSGCGWGLIAYVIGSAALGHSIWAGIVAAPVIGALVGAVSRPVRDKPRVVQIAVSLLDLYLAATCFAIATTLPELAWGTHRPESPVVLSRILGVLWGLTFTGYVLVLWPLAFVNHRIVWRGCRGR